MFPPVKGTVTKMKQPHTHCEVRAGFRFFSPFHEAKLLSKSPIKQHTALHLKCGTAERLILERGCTVQGLCKAS
jgi:hypothetical protein